MFSGAAAAGERLLATGGVTSIEGAGGGGLTPWAVITGYATRDQFGATAFATHAAITDFSLRAAGAAVGIRDRVELSYAREELGLGSTVPGQSIRQDVAGVKLKLWGDAVFDQDSPLPQVAAGLQYKRNLDMTVPRLLGALHSSGTDFYLAATKLYLGGLAGRNVLVNATLRATRANQVGLLGFGGDKGDRYRPEAELSAAVMLNDYFVVGAEYRTKPDNLSVFREDAFSDLFAAWFINRNISLTLAYVHLGQVTDKKDQKATYLSVQVGM